MMRDLEILDKLAREFPFAGYTENGRGAYLNILRTARKYLPAKSRILDFGSGPCDKTGVLQLAGYQCSAYDDLDDNWHRISGNREKILRFAASLGIDFHVAMNGKFPFELESFDMVMLHDVLEHLHDSPCPLLNSLLEFVRPGGYLYATVPSAVQIKKRVNVLFGRTNMPAFEQYYWYPDRWRGHVREYVKHDLVQLARFLGLETMELRTCDHMLHAVPKPLLPFYVAVTTVFPGGKDSWQLVARKPEGWRAKLKLDDAEMKAVLGKGTPYQYH